MSIHGLIHTEKSENLGDSKKGLVYAEMGIRNSVSIHESSLTLGGPHKDFLRKNLGVLGIRSMANTLKKYL